MSSLVAKLAEAGVRAYCYFTVDGWGPRLDALLPFASAGASAYDEVEDRALIQASEVLLTAGGLTDTLPKTVHQKVQPGYRFSTEWPDFSAEEESPGKLSFGAEVWVPCLTDPASSVSESWDMRENTVSHGQLTLEVIDPASPASYVVDNYPGLTPAEARAKHGWTPDSLFTDLLASRKRIHGELTLTMTAGKHDTGLAILDSPILGSLTHGQTWWLGREALVYVGQPLKFGGGLGSRAIGPWVRGVFGTEAAQHFTFELGGDGFLCDHPTYFRNRGIKVYLGVYAEDSGHPELHRKLGVTNRWAAGADGDVAWHTRGVINPYSPATEPRYGVDGAIAGYDTLIWQGELTDWNQSSPEGFTFNAKAMSGRLDRLMGFQQFTAKTRGPGRNMDPADIVAAIGRQQVLNCYAEVAETPRVVQQQRGAGVAGGYVDADGVADTWDGHVRVGGMLCTAEHTALAFDDDGAPLTPIVQNQRYRVGGGDGRRSGWGHLGTAQKFPGQGQEEPSLEFYEVLLTHPLAYGKKWFALDNVATCHPIQVALMLMLSEGDYAVLPQQWQGGMKESDLNMASWTEAFGNSQGIFVPGLVVGWDGKTVLLREYLEREVLGPCGIVMVTDAQGKIAARMLGDAYPGVEYPALTEAEILDPPGASQAGNQSAMVGGITYRYDYDWSGQRAEEWQDHIVLDGTALERHDLMGSVTTFESKGLMQDDTFGIGPLAMSMALRLARIFSEPFPLVTVAVGMDKLDIAVADIVTLTVSTLSHPITGQRGYEQQPCIVTSRSLALGEARITLELMPVEEKNTCLWAPSAQVSQQDATNNGGLGPLVYVNKNVYCDGQAYSTIPLIDPDAFGDVKDGGDAVYVALRTRKGMWLTDKPHLVLAAGEFQGQGYIKIAGPGFIGDNAEVVRKFGDVVEFVHYGPGDGDEDDPTHPWSTYMKEHAAQADTADLDIGSTDDEPKEYGL